MQLCKKLKLFDQFFTVFLESTSTFQHFETKLSLRSQVIPKIFTRKKVIT